MPIGVPQGFPRTFATVCKHAELDPDKMTKAEKAAIVKVIRMLSRAHDRVNMNLIVERYNLRQELKRLTEGA